MVVSITVQNTGNRAGEEVVQLYIRGRVSSLIRPIRELKEGMFLILTVQSAQKMNGRFLVCQQLILRQRKRGSVYICHQKLFQALWSPSTLDWVSVSGMEIYIQVNFLLRQGKSLLKRIRHLMRSSAVISSMMTSGVHGNSLIFSTAAAGLYQINQNWVWDYRVKFQPL